MSGAFHRACRGGRPDGAGGAITTATMTPVGSPPMNWIILIPISAA